MLDMRCGKILMAKATGQPVPDIKKKSLGEMIIDSAIFGGLAFFSVWSTGSAELLMPAAVSFGSAFVLQLALERGLRK